MSSIRVLLHVNLWSHSFVFFLNLQIKGGKAAAGDAKPKNSKASSLKL